MRKLVCPPSIVGLLRCEGKLTTLKGLPGMGSSRMPLAVKAFPDFLNSSSLSMVGVIVVIIEFNPEDYPKECLENTIDIVK